MPEVAKPEDAADHFSWNAWHYTGVERKIFTKGMAWCR